jgi:hypothetical protein
MAEYWPRRHKTQIGTLGWTVLVKKIAPNKNRLEAYARVRLSLGGESNTKPMSWIPHTHIVTIAI